MIVNGHAEVRIGTRLCRHTICSRYFEVWDLQPSQNCWYWSIVVNEDLDQWSCHIFSLGCSKMLLQGSLQLRDFSDCGAILHEFLDPGPKPTKQAIAIMLEVFLDPPMQANLCLALYHGFDKGIVATFVTTKMSSAICLSNPHLAM